MNEETLRLLAVLVDENRQRRYYQWLLLFGAKHPYEPYNGSDDTLYSLEQFLALYHVHWLTAANAPPAKLA
jgi:hypothetical protein